MKTYIITLNDGIVYVEHDYVTMLKKLEGFLRGFMETTEFRWYGRHHIETVPGVGDVHNHIRIEVWYDGRKLHDVDMPGDDLRELFHLVQRLADAGYKCTGLLPNAALNTVEYLKRGNVPGMEE